MDPDFTRRFDTALKTLALTRADSQLHDSQEGTYLILRTVEDMFNDLQNDLQPYMEDLGFSVVRDDDVASIRVRGPGTLLVYLEYQREREFTKNKNRLKTLVGHAYPGLGFDPSSIGDPGKRNSDVLFREDFIPIFDEERQVLWADRMTKTQKSSKLIVDLVIDQYLKEIEKYVDRIADQNLI